VDEDVEAVTRDEHRPTDAEYASIETERAVRERRAASRLGRSRRAEYQKNAWPVDGG